jgi:dipeptidyl aminopeptidase/acylaminoacyl peptidase
VGDTNNVDALSQRYARAVQLTAPKVATQTPGLAVEGYWLDENRFFFLAEKIESSLRRVVSIPSIAYCDAQRVEELMSLESLADVLTSTSGQLIDLATLSQAEFDMPDRDTLAVSVGSRDYLLDPRGRRLIAAQASMELPALYSPDGRYACFVKGYDLWLKDRNTGAERLLTADGEQYQRYGQQPESCTAAVSYRKRPAPMGLWSADSQWFLTHRIDERAVPDLPLVEHVPPAGGRPVLHTYKYPLPDDPLPIATFVAIHIDTGRVITFDDFPAPVLIASPFAWRLAWFSGSNAAWFLRFDRYFKRSELIRLDLAKATGCVVLAETTEQGYLDPHHILGATPNVRTLPDCGEIVWFSERDGRGHLYLYDLASGELKNRITEGDWVVREIVHVDVERRKLLFAACGIDPQADPARRSLCAINLDGSGFEVLLMDDGDVFLPKTEPCGLGQDRPFRPPYAQDGIAPGGRWGVVRYTSSVHGNRTEIVDLQARRGFGIASAFPDPDGTPPQLISATAADGVTRLHGVLFFPSDFDESRRYPLVDYIYPGPQTTWQPQFYRAIHSAQARALAELGFVTLMLDTRGTPFRSRAVRQLGYGELLEPQLADHAAVVRQLCTRYRFLDGDRVGMLGESAGGAATARALFDYGEIFKVGVSVCGNHDSALNIATWSDKYRGPGSRERWAKQANAAVAHQLKGKLLLISGDMDENVHVGQTLLLADALIRANRDFDLLIVPNAGHQVLTSSVYALRRMWDYFVTHLLGAAPPQDFKIVLEPHELARLKRTSLREARAIL